MKRRTFLKTASAGILGVSLIPWFEGCESNTIQALSSGTDIPFLTPSETMYYQNGAQASIPQWSMPVLDATWTLTVDGLFTAAATFTLNDLITLGAASMVTFFKTQQCVLDSPLSTNVTGLTGNAYWKGFPLQVLLDHCGINHTTAKRVRIYGADNFRNNMKLERIYGTQPGDLLPVMLVTEMNGAPLSAQHGYPLRMIAPEQFGYKSVKWISRIEATDQDVTFGTYQDAGFFDDGTLGVNSKITKPLDSVSVQAGTFQVTGFAVSGYQVSKVEISVDGAPFELAEIVTINEILQNESGIPAAIIEQVKQSYAYPYRGVWAKWRYLWNAVPGAHTLAIKATDSQGRVQPIKDTDQSDGANGIATINVTVG